MKTLCWELKDDGKYCKNYNLKYQNKCAHHYKSTLKYTFKYMLFILSMYVIIFYYLFNINDGTINVIREYTLALYKIDNRIFNYLNVVYYQVYNQIYHQIYH